MRIKISGVVNDSIVDGAGFRLTVFTQGCHHNCKGCHNPQTHDPEGGFWSDTEDILNIAAENPLLDGITLSGGDPMVQSDFVEELFKACKEEGIQTCLESTFHANWKDIEKVLPYADIIISDIKHMDPEIHKQYTGVNNAKILENLKRLSETGKELILRIPVIPNVNDDMDNIAATADFILNEMNGNVRTLQLLSFMRLGEEKYDSLGIPYGMEGVKLNRKSFQKHVEKIAEYCNGRGIHCLVGTKEKE